MKILSKILASFSLLFFLSIVVLAQSDNRVTKGQPRILRNPKWTVIIDYVDSFDEHKPRHRPREEPPPPEEDTTHTEGHFELLGGVWDASDLPLDFTVDLRGFPADSDLAIWNAFAAWDDATSDQLVGVITSGNADVLFDDGLNTYSIRNLGGGGVLAATFITWDDANDNNEIDNSEEFLEVDVIHNSTVQWGIAGSNPKGRWWDVQNVAAHEWGHVFGLAHTGDAHEADKDQTMFASAPPKETRKQTLEADGDIPGIQSDFLGYMTN